MCCVLVCTIPLFFSKKVYDFYRMLAVKFVCVCEEGDLFAVNSYFRNSVAYHCALRLVLLLKFNVPNL